VLSLAARNLLFTAARWKRVGRRAVPGSEGVCHFSIRRRQALGGHSEFAGELLSAFSQCRIERFAQLGRVAGKGLEILSGDHLSALPRLGPRRCDAVPATRRAPPLHGGEVGVIPRDVALHRVCPPDGAFENQPWAGGGGWGFRWRWLRFFVAERLRDVGFGGGDRRGCSFGPRACEREGLGDV